MSRFKKPSKYKDCHYDFELYSVVKLKDGRLALITDYGIYDNQYWCEVCYLDGVHLGAADYFWYNSPTAYKSDILELANKERKRVIKEYIKALHQYKDVYKDHIKEMKKMVV